MKKLKSRQNGVPVSTVHGIQFMPDKLRKSRTRQTEKNLSNVAAKHYDHVDELDEPLVKSQSHESNSDGDDSWLSFKYPFENVVLSGGGSKGYAYVGGLKALEDCGVLRQIKRVAGSSAGAICGALLAVGCTPQEIATVWAGDNNYVKWIFQDQECPCCCCLPRVWKNFGVHASDRFYDILGEYFTKKTSKPDLTFAELYREYGRELYIAVTNLTKLCSEYCHVTTTPDLPIRKAVRMSMSFPVFYEPVWHNLNGSTACIYTDGGTLDQYPVSAFDGRDLEPNHNVVDETLADPPNNRTIGFYLMSECATDHKIWHSIFGTSIPTKPTYLPNTKLARKRLREEARRRKAFTPHKSLSQLQAEMKVINPDTGEMMHYSLSNNDHVHIKNLGQYFSTSIEALLISQRRLHIKPSDVRRTVAINCGYIGTSDYTIEPDDREFMIRQGYAHVMQFLQTYAREHSGQTVAGEQVHTTNVSVGSLLADPHSKASSTVDIQVEIDNLTSELAELDTKIPQAFASSVPGVLSYQVESHSRRGSSATPAAHAAPLAVFDSMTPEHSSSVNGEYNPQSLVGGTAKLNGLEGGKVVTANGALTSVLQCQGQVVQKSGSAAALANSVPVLPINGASAHSADI